MNRSGWGQKKAAIAAVLALFATATVAATSVAAPTAVAATPSSLSCWMSSTSASTTPVATTQDLAMTVTGAPSQSLPGGTFTYSFASQAQTVPTTALSNPVTSEGSIRLALPLPAGANYQSATLSGGANVGSGATVTEVSDVASPSGVDVVETVPGPIAAGQTFTLPTLDLTVTASSVVGTNITSSLLDVQPVGTATSSTDPVLSSVLQTTVTSGTTTTTVPVTDTCWPAASPAPALSTTAVVAIDTLPPAIDLVAPTDGAVYTVGQTVDASYTCSDVASYGIATCTGTVPDGSAIDTSTVGTHTFTVNATDLRGTPATQSVSYYVQAAPTTTVIGPTDAGTVPLATGTSCSFGGTGCAAPAPPEATYEVTAPTANGGNLVMGDTFTVTWQVYKPGAYTTTASPGPFLTWTLPAPTGTVIEGPVTTSAVGLDSPTAGQGSLTGAGACTDATCTTHSTPTGLLLVNGTSYTGNAYNPPGPLSSLTTSWVESSNPSVGTDGIYLELTYTVKVTAPGTVSLPGFAPITAPTGLASVTVGPQTGVSFTVIDPTPPTISITSPTDGGRYGFGQSVPASFSCADPVVTVTSCVGTVATGSNIDTTSSQPNGIHTFTVTAADSVGNTATSTVEYFVVATPPVANPQTFSVALGGSAALPVLSSDTATDYPIDPQTVTIVTPPTYGTVTVNPNGTVLYTNDHASSLTDSFTYTVADTAGNVSNVTTVSLAIVPPLDVQTASSLPPGLILQQPSAIPTDVLGSTVSSGGTCTGAPLTLDGQPQSACGQLAPVTVINDGGVDQGWSLTGQVSDFVDPSAGSSVSCNVPTSYVNVCIPGGNLGWTPEASVNASLPTSPAQVIPGAVIDPASVFAPGTAVSPPHGLSSAPQMLCQAPAGASLGSFSCGAGIVLPVPASAAAPSLPGYQATLTLTLS
ncbi:MAG: Ig-like domain-containing protein [Acidimicrobiales bacterium]